MKSPRHVFIFNYVIRHQLYSCNQVISLLRELPHPSNLRLIIVKVFFFSRFSCFHVQSLSVSRAVFSSAPPLGRASCASCTVCQFHAQYFRPHLRLDVLPVLHVQSVSFARSIFVRTSAWTCFLCFMYSLSVSRAVFSSAPRLGRASCASCTVCRFHAQYFRPHLGLDVLTVLHVQSVSFARSIFVRTSAWTCFLCFMYSLSVSRAVFSSAPPLGRASCASCTVCQFHAQYFRPHLGLDVLPVLHVQSVSFTRSIFVRTSAWTCFLCFMYSLSVSRAVFSSAPPLGRAYCASCTVCQFRVQYFRPHLRLDVLPVLHVQSVSFTRSIFVRTSAWTCFLCFMYSLSVSRAVFSSAPRLGRASCASCTVCQFHAQYFRPHLRLDVLPVLHVQSVSFTRSIFVRTSAWTCLLCFMYSLSVSRAVFSSAPRLGRAYCASCTVCQFHAQYFRPHLRLDVLPVLHVQSVGFTRSIFVRTSAWTCFLCFMYSLSVSRAVFSSAPRLGRASCASCTVCQFHAQYFRPHLRLDVLPVLHVQSVGFTRSIFVRTSAWTCLLCFMYSLSVSRAVFSSAPPLGRASCASCTVCRFHAQYFRPHLGLDVLPVLHVQSVGFTRSIFVRTSAWTCFLCFMYSLSVSRAVFSSAPPLGRASCASCTVCRFHAQYFRPHLGLDVLTVLHVQSVGFTRSIFVRTSAWTCLLCFMYSLSVSRAVFSSAPPLGRASCASCTVCQFHAQYFRPHLGLDVLTVLHVQSLSVSRAVFSSAPRLGRAYCASCTVSFSFTRSIFVRTSAWTCLLCFMYSLFQFHAQYFRPHLGLDVLTVLHVQSLSVSRAVFSSAPRLGRASCASCTVCQFHAQYFRPHLGLDVLPVLHVQSVSFTRSIFVRTSAWTCFLCFMYSLSVSRAVFSSVPRLGRASCASCTVSFSFTRSIFVRTSAWTCFLCFMYSLFQFHAQYFRPYLGLDVLPVLHVQSLSVSRAVFSSAPRLGRAYCASCTVSFSFTRSIFVRTSAWTCLLCFMYSLFQFHAQYFRPHLGLDVLTVLHVQSLSVSRAVFSSAPRLGRAYCASCTVCQFHAQYFRPYLCFDVFTVKNEIRKTSAGIRALASNRQTQHKIGLLV